MRNPARRLWTQHAAGAPLSAAERGVLLSALEADETFRRELISDAQTDGMLRGLAAAEGDGESFARGVLVCLRAREDETRFVKKVESSLASRRPGARAGLAAAVAAGFAALLFFSARTRDERLAKFQLVEGRVLVDDKPVRAGQDFPPGPAVEVADGRAVLTYPDRTEVDLGPETTAKAGPNGFELLRGTATVDAVRPLRLGTPHGEVQAAGAAFRIAIGPETSRLETSKGEVRFRRAADGKEVTIPSGHFAIASPASDLVARLSPIDEIALTPARASVTGDAWRLVRDDQASSGWAIERRGASGVVFAFAAEANKEYAVTVRARSMSGAADLVLEVSNGLFLDRCASPESAAYQAFAFDGGTLGLEYGWQDEGHRWVGSDPGNADRLPDVTRAVVRFNRPGPQSLKLSAKDGPLRVDVVRLTATQRTGPEIALRAH
jgi:ferric-dicitrate binding protein FerR (iron transport regulator)